MVVLHSAICISENRRPETLYIVQRVGGLLMLDEISQPIASSINNHATYSLDAANTSNIQPAIIDSPPMGAVAPNLVIPVKQIA